MDKFKVSLEWTAHTTIEVEAESLDDAMLKARDFNQISADPPKSKDLHCFVDHEQSLMENMDPEPEGDPAS